jgi:hypothetical protein
MKFVKNIKKTNQTKTKSKDSVIVVLAVLLVSIASLKVASTIAAQEVNAKPRIPQKDHKTERNVKHPPTEKKSSDTPTDKDGSPIAPLELPPGSELPLPPPPHQECPTCSFIP